MAKKRTKSKKVASAKSVASTPTPDRPGIQDVRIVWETEPIPVHSDFAAVGVRPPGDFSLTLCSLSVTEPKRDETGKLVANARIVAAVRMNAQSYLNLTVLMMNQWNKLVDAKAIRGAAKFLGFENPEGRKESPGKG